MVISVTDHKLDSRIQMTKRSVSS